VISGEIVVDSDILYVHDGIMLDNLNTTKLNANKGANILRVETIVQHIIKAYAYRKVYITYYYFVSISDRSQSILSSLS